MDIPIIAFLVCGVWLWNPTHEGGGGVMIKLKRFFSGSSSSSSQKFSLSSSINRVFPFSHHFCLFARSNCRKGSKIVCFKIVSSSSSSRVCERGIYIMNDIAAVFFISQALIFYSCGNSKLDSGRVLVIFVLEFLLAQRWVLYHAWLSD